MKRFQLSSPLLMTASRRGYQVPHVNPMPPVYRSRPDLSIASSTSLRSCSHRFLAARSLPSIDNPSTPLRSSHQEPDQLLDSQDTSFGPRQMLAELQSLFHQPVLYESPSPRTIKEYLDNCTTFNLSPARAPFAGAGTIPPSPCTSSNFCPDDASLHSLPVLRNENPIDQSEVSSPSDNSSMCSLERALNFQCGFVAKTEAPRTLLDDGPTWPYPAGWLSDGSSANFDSTSGCQSPELPPASVQSSSSSSSKSSVDYDSVSNDSTGDSPLDSNQSSSHKSSNDDLVSEKSIGGLPLESNQSSCHESSVSGTLPSEAAPASSQLSSNDYDTTSGNEEIGTAVTFEESWTPKPRRVVRLRRSPLFKFPPLGLAPAPCPGAAPVTLPVSPPVIPSPVIRTTSPEDSLPRSPYSPRRAPFPYATRAPPPSPVSTYKLPHGAPRPFTLMPVSPPPHVPVFEGPLVPSWNAPGLRIVRITRRQLPPVNPTRPSRSASAPPATAAFSLKKAASPAPQSPACSPVTSEPVVAMGEMQSPCQAYLPYLDLIMDQNPDIVQIDKPFHVPGAWPEETKCPDSSPTGSWSFLKGAACRSILLCSLCCVEALLNAEASVPQTLAAATLL
ncbi:hypothetical protein BP6252_00312 [Coleophoma cylindrospora]|uniref:Uncharacterized protein n=1 Tax=Coleophoma cylindrospora TaxID=1849047 RepID=A0A3D8SPN5_9HELO|nr:hypothetical protein BP6252_00312 [Coleophoma cylindrospora]